ERSGKLKAGQTVIEATSGNTGIALAMVCASRGYPFVAVMVETFSIERRKIMKALGAKVILTPASERGTGMVKKASELAEKHGWFLADQFNNPANPEYHKNTTAVEIISDFRNHELDYFVSGWGTGGTITGVGKMLKTARPNINVIAVEPELAPLVSKNEWEPHKIQGWTPDFIPDVLDKDVIDKFVTVNDERSIETSKELARQEGIFTGISGGATMLGALLIAEDAPKNSTFCVMLPDTGERYLSSPLFADITEDSDDEWLAQQ
ncbi:MAG TPA: pyridoxal-phosphate dependent enzyme, partial [Gammaproteobacteria bacterium]|nr:pyridoxal-phosphate dependent enzyme [Gammaproteobacteria bacterium]